jgi:predicted flap endonuclease-1-like 5' DNA nuclease
MDWTSLIIGVIVGWIIALIIYGIYSRDRMVASEASPGAAEAQRAQLRAAEAHVKQLESDLVAANTARSEALAEAEAEIERLRAELDRQPAPPAEVVAAPEAQLPPPEPSDLKRVEGIGPKIEEIFNNAGIHTFQQLADAAIDRLQEILAEAGERFTLADPGTWAAQARLAAEEKWDELQALQDSLKAGRE